MNAQRIWGIVLRHVSVYRTNIARLNELVFWPFFELLLWGFFGLYIRNISSVGYFLTGLLSALLLWTVFSRIQQSIAMSFLMELWSRNLMNIFVSPISLLEYLIGLIIVAILRIAFVSLLLWISAYFLYSVNLLSVGPALVPLAINLILFGWALGTLTTSIVLRFGQSAEALAWSFAFFLQPLGAIFFPVSVYPAWLQSIIWWIPLPHIFEALRAIFAGQEFPVQHIYWAFGLNAVYVVAAYVFFGFMFEKARVKGFLMKLQD